MLTDKAKEEFEWYWEPLPREERLIKYKATKDSIDFSWSVNEFYDLPFSMQYGCYVDFFDSVGIYIQAESFYHAMEHLSFEHRIRYKGKTITNGQPYYRTRNEARKKAIEKANTIYNETN